MNISNIDKKAIHEIIKTALTEAVREELLNYKLKAVQFADEEEMDEIEKDLKKKKGFNNQEYRELKV